MSGKEEGKGRVRIETRGPGIWVCVGESEGKIPVRTALYFARTNVPFAKTMAINEQARSKSLNTTMDES